MKITVRSGDTFWYFSRLFMIPLNLLMDSNIGIHPERLIAGQEIRIPGFTTQSFRIKQGDSFWKIAISRNLSVDALLLLNPIINPNKLMVGQTIQIPKRVISHDTLRRSKYDYAQLQKDLQTLKSHFPFMQLKTMEKVLRGRKPREYHW